MTLKKTLYVCNCDCRMTETKKHQYEVNHGSEFLSGSISVFSPEALRGGRRSSGLPNGDGLERAAACGRDLGNAHSWHRGDKARGGTIATWWVFTPTSGLASVQEEWQSVSTLASHTRVLVLRRPGDKLFLLNHSRAPHKSCQLGSGCGGREVISGLAPTLFHLTCRPSSPRLASILESRT